MGYGKSLAAPYHSIIYGKATYCVKIHTLPVHWIGMAIDPHQSHTAKFQIDMETVSWDLLCACTWLKIVLVTWQEPGGICVGQEMADLNRHLKNFSGIRTPPYFMHLSIEMNKKTVLPWDPKTAHKCQHDAVETWLKPEIQQFNRRTKWS